MFCAVIRLIVHKTCIKSLLLCSQFFQSPLICVYCTWPATPIHQVSHQLPLGASVPSLGLSNKAVFTGEVFRSSLLFIYQSLLILLLNVHYSFPFYASHFSSSFQSFPLLLLLTLTSPSSLTSFHFQIPYLRMKMTLQRKTALQIRYQPLRLLTSLVCSPICCSSRFYLTVHCAWVTWC